MAPSETAVLTLPAVVVSRVDVMRLLRELDAVAATHAQAKIAKAKPETTRLSKMLDEVVHVNKLDLSRDGDLTRLQGFLQELKRHAPTIHMSFATVPTGVFTTKIVEWLRDEVHPLMLLDIGLQPSIAAGCVIRTTNKYIDCSMRQHLLKNRPQLIEMIRAKAGSPAA